MKRTWEYRRDYFRVADAFCKVNRDVGQHLEALYEAMRRRDSMRPRYERARKALDKAVYRDARARHH